MDARTFDQVRSKFMKHFFVKDETYILTLSTGEVLVGTFSSEGRIFPLDKNWMKYNFKHAELISSAGSTSGIVEDEKFCIQNFRGHYAKSNLTESDFYVVNSTSGEEREIASFPMVLAEAETFQPEVFEKWVNFMDHGISIASPASSSAAAVSVPQAMRGISPADFIERLELIGENIEDPEYVLGHYTMYMYVVLTKKYGSGCFVFNPEDHANFVDFNNDSKQLTYSHHLGVLLRECLERNTEVILIPLGLDNVSIGFGHANLLIYRPDQRIIERFEPQGVIPNMQTEVLDEPALNEALKNMFEVELRPFLKDYTPSYVPPEGICPSADVFDGFQTLENKERTVIKPGENEGTYCLLWTFFLMECILMNPRVPTAHIIDRCMQTAKKQNKRFLHIIRGYLKSIADEVRLHFKHASTIGKQEWKTAVGTEKKDTKYVLHAATKAKRQPPGFLHTVAPLATTMIDMLPSREVVMYIAFVEHILLGGHQDLDSFVDEDGPISGLKKLDERGLRERLATVISSDESLTWERVNHRFFRWFFDPSRPNTQTDFNDLFLEFPSRRKPIVHDPRMLPIYIYFVENDAYPCKALETMMELHDNFRYENLREIVAKAETKHVDFFIFLRMFQRSLVRQSEQDKKVVALFEKKEDVVHEISVSVRSFPNIKLNVFYQLLVQKQLTHIERTYDEDQRYELIDAVIYVMSRHKIYSTDVLEFFSIMKYVRFVDARPTETNSPREAEIPDTKRLRSSGGRRTFRQKYTYRSTRKYF